MAENKELIPKDDLESFVQKMPAYFQNFANSSINVFDFVHEAAVAIRENSKLNAMIKTKEGKQELAEALRRGLNTGLSLDPEKGEAALIPFGGKIKFMKMKNGIVRLILRTGKVQSVITETIYENDDFKMTKTLSKGADFSHVPAEKNKGEIRFFLAAILDLKGYGYIQLMTPDDVNEIRNRYSKSFKKDDPECVWNKFYREMGEKTVLKKLCRKTFFPDVTSTEYMPPLDDDDDEYTIRNATPEPVEKGTSANDLTSKLSKSPPPDPSSPVQTESHTPFDSSEPLDLF